MRQLCAATTAAPSALRGIWPAVGAPAAWEEDGATGKGRLGGRRGAYFYEQEMLIGQLLEYEELGWGAIGEYFFLFPKKIKMEKRDMKLLEMLQ